MNEERAVSNDDSRAGPGAEAPNAARIYDYLVGGSHSLPADRAAADFMCTLVPSTPKWLSSAGTAGSILPSASTAG
jgi:hypothetical protein